MMIPEHCSTVLHEDVIPSGDQPMGIMWIFSSEVIEEFCRQAIPITYTPSWTCVRLKTMAHHHQTAASVSLWMRVFRQFQNQVPFAQGA